MGLNIWMRGCDLSFFKSMLYDDNKNTKILISKVTVLLPQIPIILFWPGMVNIVDSDVLVKGQLQMKQNTVFSFNMCICAFYQNVKIITFFGIHLPMYDQWPMLGKVSTSNLRPGHLVHLTQIQYLLPAAGYIDHSPVFDGIMFYRPSTQIGGVTGHSLRQTIA